MEPQKNESNASQKSTFTLSLQNFQQNHPREQYSITQLDKFRQSSSSSHTKHSTPSHVSSEGLQAEHGFKQQNFTEKLVCAEVESTFNQSFGLLDDTEDRQPKPTCLTCPQGRRLGNGGKMCELPQWVQHGEVETLQTKKHFRQV